MTTQTATNAAYAMGARFAAELNNGPDADNWSKLEPGDDLPEFDYLALRDQYGITAQIEAAYRAGFNDTFRA